MKIPVGVLITPLKSHEDHRGVFTELFRQEWNTGIDPIQWNIVKSKPKTFRGVHVHLRHCDYFITVQGNICIGLKDLRKKSPTYALEAIVETNSKNLLAITIPRGVAHGFYSHTSSLHLYSVSHYWDTSDELACHYADPELNFAWPFKKPLLSERDLHAMSYQELLKELEPWQETLMANE